MFDVVEHEFGEGDFLEVGEEEGGEGAEQPGRPGHVQSPHGQTGIVFGSQQDQLYGEGNVTWIEDEESALGDYLVVEGHKEAPQACPEANLLWPSAVHLGLLRGSVGKLLAPAVNDDEGESSEEYSDAEVIEGWYFVVALISTELADARLCDSRSHVLV